MDRERKLGSFRDFVHFLLLLRIISKLKDAEMKALLLHLNSSFGIALYFSHRVSSYTGYGPMKKPAWESMPVLNVLDLAEHQVDALERVYDELGGKSLKPIFQLVNDETRIAIDDALCDVLKLPDIKPLRQLIGREPGIKGQKHA